ncbi:MAG: ABC transporter permease [Clostridia bacterium]|nr:ABC transporter permease [Clostridia bacterium]
MSIIENIRIAIFSIKTNLMRSVLTMLGIIIGVASVIAIITVGNGGKDYIVNLINEMNSNTVTLQVASNAETDEYITSEDINKIKNVDSISYVSPMVYRFCSASSSENKALCFIMAGNADLKQLMNITILKGRFFTADEYRNASNVCVIPEIGAMTMFGKMDCLGESITIKVNGQSRVLKVIGITNTDITATSGDTSNTVERFEERAAELEGDFGESMSSTNMIALVVPCTVTDQLIGRSGLYQMIYLSSNDSSQLASIGNAAKNILYARHGNFGSDTYSVVNMESYANLADKIINILTTFIAGISAISLVVGGIGVMNIMLVSVTERTREIGIRKALGAKTSAILLQFLTESVILCLIGGVVGFILGVALAAIVAAFAGIPIAIKLSTVVIAVGFSSAVGIFFGIYPARKAARMLPIEALRRE